jgi:hypothetical protein
MVYALFVVHNKTCMAGEGGAMNLRWHVTRKFRGNTVRGEGDAAGASGSGRISVQVEQGAEAIGKRGVKALLKQEADQLDWWSEDEERQLNGTVPEEALKDAIIKNNIAPAAAKGRGGSGEDREIREDMVFLQQVEDDGELGKVWKKLKGTEARKLPDLSPLLGLKGEWSDFTPQARSMASAVYRKVLKEEGGAAHESK